MVSPQSRRIPVSKPTRLAVARSSMEKRAFVREVPRASRTTGSSSSSSLDSMPPLPSLTMVSPSGFGPTLAARVSTEKGRVSFRSTLLPPAVQVAHATVLERLSASPPSIVKLFKPSHLARCHSVGQPQADLCFRQRPLSLLSEVRICVLSAGARTKRPLIIGALRAR